MKEFSPSLSERVALEAITAEIARVGRERDKLENYSAQLNASYTEIVAEAEKRIGEKGLKFNGKVFSLPGPD